MGRWPVVVILALLFLGGTWAAYRHGAEVTDSTWLAKWEREVAEQSVRLAALTQQARDAEQAKTKAIGEIERRYAQELNDAKVANDRLRDDVDSGAKRLRILARRPASCPAVPGATDGAELDTDTAVELAPTARRSYFRLRDAITSDTSKLRACQQILRELTAQP